MALTKQDLGAIGNILDKKLDIKLVPVYQEIRELKGDVKALREQIQQLAVTLDNFLKQLSDYREEFALLKSEVDQIKRIIKAKLGVEVAIQNSSF